MKTHIVMSIFLSLILVACGGNGSPTTPQENRYKLVNTVIWRSNECFYTLMDGETINIFDKNDFEKAKQVYTDDIQKMQCGVKDSNNNFISLSDIDLFSNISSLSLGGYDFTTRIGSLSNISTLKKLNYLYLNTYFDYAGTDNSVWSKLHLKTLHTVNQVNELYQIKTLETLSTSVYDLSSVQRLYELPNLKHLSVKFEHPKHIDINFISKLDNLETLEMKIWADEIRDFFPHNPDVTYSANDLKINLVKISNLNNLKALNINSLIVEDLGTVKNLESLQSLSLTDYAGMVLINFPDSAADISALKCGENLHKLDLSGWGYQEQTLDSSCNQLTEVSW